MSNFKKQLEIAQNNAKNDKSLKDMVMQQKFGKLFALMRNNRHLEEERVGLHASAIIASESDFCLRQQVLSLLFKMDQGEELPIKALQIFSAGSSIHEKWQGMLESCSGEKGNSIKLIKNEARSYNEEYEIYFTPDSIVEINGQLYIVEYKSMNTFAYKAAINASNPHPSARKQSQLYMFLTGIGKAIILIEDKNTQDFMTYVQKFNYKEVLPYIDRLNEIKECKKEYLKSGNLPEKICRNSKTKKACNCSMRSACFDINIGRVSL